MKVVFLLTQDRGGPVDLTVGLATELAGRAGGPEVTIVVPAPASGAALPRDLVRQVHVRAKADHRGFAAVATLLGRRAPVISHAQDRRAGLGSSLHGHGTPPVVTDHCSAASACA